MRKLITLILTIAVIFQVFIPVTNHAAYKSDSKKLYVFDVTLNPSDTSQECVRKWNTISNDVVTPLPVFVKNKGPILTIGSDKYGFNFTLWDEKRIAVYSEAENVKVNVKKDAQSGMKDFKTKQDDSSCGEYYLYGGRKGEFRYHGFDVNSNRYSNTSFPPDTAVSLINSYNWKKSPWDDNLCQKSVWNYAADDRNSPTKPAQVKTEGNYVYTWIKALYKDEPNPNIRFSDKTNLTFSNVTSYTGNPNDYANVMSAPTLTYPGEAKLWHSSGGTNWYRTTFVEPIGDKIFPNIELTGITTDTKIVEKKTIVLDSIVEATVKLNSTLKDESYYGSEVLSTVYYNRKDIKGGTNGWSFSLQNSDEGSKGGQKVNNKSNTTFKVRAKLREFKNGVLTLPATATVITMNNKTKSQNATVNVAVTLPTPPPGEEEKEPVDETEAFPPPPPPQYVTPNVIIPDPAFDIVPHPCTDNTIFEDSLGEPVNIVEKRVFVDGTPVDYDYFFSGNYVFGETGKDRLSNILVEYESEEGKISHVSRWIRVLSTKPRVQLALSGSYRQNRKLAASNTSSSANTPEVINRYPITSYRWTVEALTGDGASIRTGSSTDMLREFTFKKPGTYRISLVGTNTLGKTSDPYTVDFEILADIPAAVICELNNVKLARGETIGTYAFEAVSTDGDSIEATNAKLYYDSNNDGTPESLVQTWSNVQNAAFPTYTVNMLGMYRYVIESTENLAGDLIPGHTDASDKTVKIIQRDFWCDNYIPQTGLYVNIPVVRANIDVFIMMDANLNSSKVDYIKNSRIDFNNYLRSYNILPVVENWDMHTYTYSQAANTSVYSGSSYPSATTPYSSNGYSGTLSRRSVSDNGSYHDNGSWQSRVESSTATQYFSGSWNNTVHWINGVGTFQSSPAPGSLSINSNGYSGSIPRTGTTAGPATILYNSKGQGYESWQTFTALYGGTLSKTVYNTVTYWQSNYVWYSSYTGYYNGTIYKNLRQPYTDPFRATSNKYVIYVSDGNIAELADLNNVITKSGAKLILVSANSATSQRSYNNFIFNNRPIADVMKDALDIIAQNSPTVEENYILAGIDTFQMNTDDFDQEGDAIISQQYQYVQDINYFDNSQGLEANAVVQYSETAGWTSTKADRFNKPGKYTIYRRIQDRPSNDPNFSQFSYFSGSPMLVIYAHRKPIARANLDWNYDSTNAVYQTTWVDMSYDLDHQFNRPDKGIIERKIMFRQAGGGWQYIIPATLSPGTYELQYYVKDIEGAWSEPFIMNFMLNAAPPMQFNASLKAENSLFTTSSIPASENLQIYNAWTRYPYNVKLSMSLINSNGTTLTPIKTVDYSAATGIKAGNDINWNNISYTIPEALPDGAYTFRITAIGEYGQTKYIDFPVTVVTPINLKGYINSKLSSAEIYTDETNKFTFTSTVYPTSVQLRLKGVTYTSASGQIALISNDGITKTWELQKFIPDNSMTDGETGDAVFMASLPSGGSQTVLVDYKVIALRLKNLRIYKINDFSWKDVFVKPNGDPTALQLNGIPVKDMPVYKSLTNKYIKLGYKVKFKIDSMGLYRPEDKIFISVKYFALDDSLNCIPADIFIEKTDGNHCLLENSDYMSSLETIVLDESKRTQFEADKTKSTYNTWAFDFYLPPTIKAVRKGQKLDLFNDNTLKTKLLVVFDITCKKGGSPTTYDYTVKETAWGSDNGSIYGKSYPTKREFLGKGINAGEVFWYDLSETALNDIEINREW